ncbi:unnamed protein product, partial [Laminaria digitata]
MYCQDQCTASRYWSGTEPYTFIGSASFSLSPLTYCFAQYLPFRLHLTFSFIMAILIPDLPACLPACRRTPKYLAEWRLVSTTWWPQNSPRNPKNLPRNDR